MLCIMARPPAPELQVFKSASRTSNLESRQTKTWPAISSDGRASGAWGQGQVSENFPSRRQIFGFRNYLIFADRMDNDSVVVFQNRHQGRKRYLSSNRSCGMEGDTSLDRRIDSNWSDIEHLGNVGAEV